MGLSNFFRINMPYGISRNKKGEWFAFNREYLPIGWNSKSHQKSIYVDNVYGEMPIYTKYTGLTEAKLKELGHDKDSIHLDDKGKIERVFFYNDRTNPSSNPKYWPDYFEKLKILGKLSRK
jgi:hypothetical protein